MTNNLGKILKRVDEKFQEGKRVETHKGEVKSFLRKLYSEEMTNGGLGFHPEIPGCVALRFDYKGNRFLVDFDDNWIFLYKNDICIGSIYRESYREDGTINKKAIRDGLNDLVGRFNKILNI